MVLLMVYKIFTTLSFLLPLSTIHFPMVEGFLKYNLLEVYYYFYCWYCCYCYCCWWYSSYLMKFIFHSKTQFWPFLHQRFIKIFSSCFQSLFQIQLFLLSFLQAIFHNFHFSWYYFSCQATFMRFLLFLGVTISQFLHIILFSNFRLLFFAPM